MRRRWRPRCRASKAPVPGAPADRCCAAAAFLVDTSMFAAIELACEVTCWAGRCHGTTAWGPGDEGEAERRWLLRISCAVQNARSSD